MGFPSAAVILSVAVSTWGCSGPPAQTPPPTTRPVASAPVAAASTPPSAPSGATAGTVDGLEISVSRVERVREWEMELMPGMPGAKLQADPGHQIAVVHLELRRATPDAKELDVKTLAVVDAAGGAHKSAVVATDICELGGAQQAGCKLPFMVSEEVTITGLKAGAATIMLASPVPARK